MLIYLMRHGQTDWNLEKRLQGDVDIPLNENGRALTRRAAEGMKDIPFDLILTSPLSRARETAAIIAGDRDIPIRVTEGLREMCFGVCEGKTAREHPLIRTFFSDPVGYVPQGGGESYQEVDRRCRRFFEEEVFPLEGKYDHVLLSTHGALCKALLRVIQDKPLEQFWDGPPQANCSVNLIEVKNGAFRVIELGKEYI